MININDYTDILWDYNGTVLDDVTVGINAINKLLKERGLKTIGSIDEYHKVFGFPIIDYYRRLGFDFEKESFESVAPIWVEEYMNGLKDATVREGIVELLELFSSKGLRQTIISAASTDMLKEQLKLFGIDKYFYEIYGLDNIHAAGKTHLATAWREAHPEAKALLIGDTIHDHETAKLARADCILVGGGHQSNETLAKTGVATVFGTKELYEMFDRQIKTAE